MTGERREIDIQGGEVHRLVGNRLARVEHRQCTDRPGPPDQFGNRRAGTGDVGMMSEGNDFHPIIEIE